MICPLNRTRCDCEKDLCEWWSPKYEHCAITMIAIGLMALTERRNAANFVLCGRCGNRLEV